MAHRIQILFACLVAYSACAPPSGPPYRGDEGRSGEYSAPGVGELDQIVWKYRAPASIAGPPTVGADAVYVASTNGVLTALKKSDGTVQWERELGTSLRGTPIVAGSRVLVGTDVGLTAVGLDGKEQWTYETGPVEGVPLVIDGIAYVGDRSGRVLAVDIVGGSLIWEAITAGPVTVSPVRVRGNVVVGSADGGIYSLDPATGEPRWTWQGPAAIRGLAAVSDRVFASVGAEVIALNADEPEASRWRADLGAIAETPPSLSGGLIVVGTGAGDVVGLDITDGSPLFRTTLSAPVRGDITVTGDRLVVPATSSGLEVVDRAGKQVWHFRTDGRVVGATPDHKRLYVTDSAGSIYALQ